MLYVAHELSKSRTVPVYFPVSMSIDYKNTSQLSFCMNDLLASKGNNSCGGRRTVIGIAFLRYHTQVLLGTHASDCIQTVEGLSAAGHCTSPAC